MMSKIVFLTFFFLLTAANSLLTQADAPAREQVGVAVDRGCAGRENPVGEGEEQSQSEEDKDATEEDDDDVNLSHRWLAREKSSNSDLRFLYQEILFKDLEIELVIPPPKA